MGVSYVLLLLISNISLLLAKNTDACGNNAHGIQLRHVPDFQRGIQQDNWKPPTHEYFERNWFSTYTANPIYPRKVKNLQFQFAPVLNGSPEGALQEITSYQSLNDTDKNGFIYASYGIDTPFDNIDAAYKFNGTGLLNFVGLQLAVLAWGLDEHDVEYMVVYLGGNETVFPTSVDIVSQRSTGPGMKTLDAIKRSLEAAKDPAVPLSMIKQLKPVVQDKDTRERHVTLNLGIMENTAPTLLIE